MGSFPNYRAQTDRKCFDQQQNQSKHSCTKSCSAELSKIGDMSTVLRLPHMDIVLECDHKVRRSRRPGNRERISPRRSDRLRNVSGGNQDHPQQTDTNVRSKRRRYNSVMDDQEDNDNDEDDDQGDKQRQEPEHRQLNRMKMQRQKIDPDPPAQAPEDVDVEKEKSLVEILLRKYGFGRWTLPPDDSSTETAEGSAFSRTALGL